MKKKFVVGLLILIAVNGSGQSIDLEKAIDVKSTGLMEDSIITIESIDINDKITPDLEKIGDKIGASKIVLLGEQSHGDGTSFKMKSRLIKYLHKKKGFDVVIFEADFYSVNKAVSTNEERVDIQKLLEENLYAFWIKPSQMKPFWDYIESTQQSVNPIIISGIDSRHVGR